VCFNNIFGPGILGGEGIFVRSHPLWLSAFEPPQFW
jgi:hypothetical protein